MKRSAEVIIRDAGETLRTARSGLQDFVGPVPARRLSGLRNLLVFGHAVTTILKQLQARTGVRSFDSWYAGEQEMIDPHAVMPFMARLRQSVLAQIEPPGFSSVSPKFRPTEVARLGRAPAGANGFFIGGAELGSGWIIGFADGCEERYYVELPEDLSWSEELSATLPVPEDTALRSRCLEELCGEYLAGLERLIAAARREFLGR